MLLACWQKSKACLSTLMRARLCREVAVTAYLCQECTVLGDSPGCETSPAPPAGVAIHSSLELGLLLSALHPSGVRVRWLLMPEQLKGTSETGREESPWVPVHKSPCSTSPADGRVILPHIYLKCFSSLTVLRVMWIFNIVVSMSLFLSRWVVDF